MSRAVMPATTAPDEGELAMLDALPLGAAIMHLQDAGSDAEKIWVEAFNDRLVEEAGDGKGGTAALAAMRRVDEGPIGDFIRAYLRDPATAPASLEHEEGAGFTYSYLLSLAPLPPRGDVRRCLFSMVDRSAEKRTEYTLKDQMARDTLTGLANRMHFCDLLDEVIAQDRAGDDGAGRVVLLVDLRRFARINVSMGPLSGDELLISTARRLVGASRDGDLLARTGANEFAILTRLEGEESAEDVAERIRDVLAEPFRLATHDIRIDCAIGIVPVADGDGEQTLRNAQFATKHAKGSGRITRYEPTQAKAARRRFSVETELRRALQRDELELHYQPLVELASGRVTGFEALARWTHADRGEIAPAEFIPVAEESGLILDLGRWAMDQAAATLARWDRAEGRTLPISLSVNLSALQLAHDDPAALVEGAIDTHRIGGDRLTLELTETAIVQDPARAQRAFEGLKALDTHLAMDDFGTGYSSLAYLQRLPIDVLKIDRRFITDMMGDADNIAIVRAILGLADALGMKTTAEGIEHPELAAQLAELGCTIGQGFHFSKAVPAARALTYWRAREEKAAREAGVAAA